MTTQNKTFDQIQHKFYDGMIITGAPVELLELSASTDIVKRDLTRDLSKTMALLDLGITCRFKTLRFELSLRNALNQNSYSYSIYRSINTYRYHYRLRGRELLLTLAVTL